MDYPCIKQSSNFYLDTAVSKTVQSEGANFAKLTLYIIATHASRNPMMRIESHCSLETHAVLRSMSSMTFQGRESFFSSSKAKLKVKTCIFGIKKKFKIYTVDPSQFKEFGISFCGKKTLLTALGFEPRSFDCTCTKILNFILLQICR